MPIRHERGEALLRLGAEAVVVTLGPRGAMLVGERRRHVAGAPAHVRSTVGAGDAFTGVLVAALTRSDYDAAALDAALSAAVLAGTRATERWGATAPAVAPGTPAFGGK